MISGSLMMSKHGDIGLNAKPSILTKTSKIGKERGVLYASRADSPGSWKSSTELLVVVYRCRGPMSFSLCQKETKIRFFKNDPNDANCAVLSMGSFVFLQCEIEVVFGAFRILLGSE